MRPLSSLATPGGLCAMPVTVVKVSMIATSGRMKLSETTSWITVEFLKMPAKITSCCLRNAGYPVKYWPRMFVNVPAAAKWRE